jgi:acetate kinase
MKSIENCVLIINGGSSSIKFALYQVESSLTRLVSGEVENIGLNNTKLNYSYDESTQKGSFDINGIDQNTTINILMDWLEKQKGFAYVSAIGHRIVQGMKYTQASLISTELLNELKEFSLYDPEHLPFEIKLIEMLKMRYPAIDQIACFDTSFHSSMPAVAKWLSIPRRFNGLGIRRYGFHGLSYSFLLEELNRIGGTELANGRTILAHLGNGASLAAVKDGKSLDTSMGFTPTSGLMMGSRPGDLDPGVAWYLMKVEKLSPEQFNHLINYESGLKGISETSSDMRELIKTKDTDSRAADAFELFCYQGKKWIGSFASILGGLDCLVFSGGIGENAPEVRKQICSGLQFLGIELEETKNIKNEAIISTATSRVTVRVIKTNEELMIARLVCHVLNYMIEK